MQNATKQPALKYRYILSKVIAKKTRGCGTLVHHNSHCIGYRPSTAWEEIHPGGDALTLLHWITQTPRMLLHLVLVVM